VENRIRCEVIIRYKSSREGEKMKVLKLAFCFLDEDDKIVAKKDLDVSWNYEGKEDKSIRNIIAIDQVASIVNGRVMEEISGGVITELLHELKGTHDE
jgi:hypothetical protein